MGIDINIVDPLSDIYTREFHIVFSFIGCVLTLVTFLGSFQMRKSYAGVMSEEQKKLLKMYATSLAVLSVLFFIFMIYTFCVENNMYRIFLLTCILFATLIVSAIMLYDRNYSIFFSLDVYIPMTRESYQKLFRYVFVSPTVLLTYASVLLFPYIHKMIGNMPKIPSLR
jgi:hypothetical protein